MRRVRKQIPCSDTKGFRKHAKAAEATLAAIDAVHGDGKLEQIPLKVSRSKASRGYYGARANKAVEIGVGGHLSTPQAKANIAHEVGHWIDHMGITPGHYASETPNSPLAAVMDAIDKTPEIASLKADAKLPVGTGQYVRYSLTGKERFARAYAQFIATHGGDPELAAEIAARTVPGKNVRIDTQWKAESFKPVSDAMVAAFKTMGWIHA